jgi:hypothetical protein
MLKKNINHFATKSQVAEKVGEKERIEKLKKTFQQAWDCGFRKFIPCEGKRPDINAINQFLREQFGKGLKELGINLYEIAELVKKEGKEEEWKSFLERCIIEGKNLASYGGYQEGLNTLLYYIDIDDKENQGKKRDEKLQLILDKFPELKNSLIVETGSGYHIWFLSDVELANCNKKGIELRGKGQYVLFPFSIHPSSGKIYEIKSGSVDNLVKLSKAVSLSEAISQGFIEIDGKNIERGITEKTITEKAGAKTKTETETKTGTGTGTGANFSFLISDEKYEWLKEKLKEKHYELWKVLEFGYEGESVFVGQKKEFDRSNYEIALARALFEICYQEGLYLRYSDDEIKQLVASFLERIPYYKVFGNREITKVRERGEKYLIRTIEKAFNFFQKKLPLTDYLRGEIERFASSCIREFFERVLKDNGEFFEGVHLNLVPGAGKTTALINHIVQLKREGKIGGEAKQRVILVFLTKELAGEVRGKLEKEGVRVLFLKGRDSENCLQFSNEFRRRLADMGGNHSFYCNFVCEMRNKCDYMNQQKKVQAIKGILRGQSEYIDFGLSEIADVIITTYDYFCEWYELLLSISKIVVFDDVVPQAKAIEVPNTEIVRTYKLIQQNYERLKNLKFQVDKVLNVLDNLKNDNLKEVIDFDDNELRKILEEVLSLREQDIEKIPNFHIAELLGYIKRFGIVKSQDGKSFIYYKFKQFERRFHSLWLGWTKRSDLIQLALPKTISFKVVEKNVDVVYRNVIDIEIENVPEATFRNLKKEKAVREVISLVKRKIEEIQKDKKILVAVPSEIEKEIKRLVGGRENISIIHYWGSETKGVNKFEDYDVAILVALPIPNVYQIRARNRFLNQIAEEKGVELIEDIATDVKEHIWQIINRLRVFRKDYKQVKVYVIGKFEGKNNTIGFAVKKFLSSFQDDDEQQQNQIERLGVGYEVYKETGGVIPKILCFEKQAKKIGYCSSEAKIFLFDLKNRFPYFSFLPADDGSIYKEYASNIKAYYKVCKTLQKLEQLESKRMKVLELRIQRKGKRNEVEMDIVKTEIWGVVGDLDEFRKKLYEKTGILIYAVVGDDGKEQKILDNWTFEKIKELELIKERFNKLNHLPPVSIEHQATDEQPKQIRLTPQIKEKLKIKLKLIDEYQKAIEVGLKQNKEIQKKYNELKAEYERRLQNDKNKTLMDYQDLVLGFAELLEEIWAEHNAKKLISKLGAYDTS